MLNSMVVSLWRSVFGSAALAAPGEDGGVVFWSNLERNGWLTKQGEYIKTWRRRWFVLKQGKLFWFKDSQVTHASVPRGVIPVVACLTVKGAEDVINRAFTFELSTRSETMYFIVDSKKEEVDQLHRPIHRPALTIVGRYRGRGLRQRQAYCHNLVLD